jgi:hypothetical protein
LCLDVERLKKFLRSFKKGIDKWGGLWYNYSTKGKRGT